MDSASDSAEPGQTLRVLTLNVWGLKYISKLRVERIEAIANRLAKGIGGDEVLEQGDEQLRTRSRARAYDVVALQEIWCESTDWKMLKERVRHLYPYSKFFFTGAFGSGLAILSAHPILHTQTHPYSLNGHPIHVHHGDWIVAKAAGCATLRVDKGGLGEVDVWVTHTVAAGGEDGPESSRAHRVSQAYQLASLAKRSAQRSRHVICLGDFNSTPPSLSLALLRDVGGLSDAFAVTHPDLPPGAVALSNTPTDQSGSSSRSARRSIEQLGVTCDSPLNTWTQGKEAKLDRNARAGLGKRLDYILYRGPAAPSPSNTRPGIADNFDSATHLSKDAFSSVRLEAKTCHVCWTETLPDLQHVSYSDHFGLSASFRILSSDEAGAKATKDHPRSTTQVAQSLTSALQALSVSLHASRASQKMHFQFFFAALLVAFALLFASPLASGAGLLAALGRFGMTLLAVVAGAAGATMLYSSVIWGEWERRTILTLIESISMELEHLRAGSPSHGARRRGARYCSGR
ncbi:hypothetical protein IE81DRAFT_336075 [Ceraceosorus guamensis]|uniref:Endonuclease/exonuclease/phosphatase domain-containing protein n=1 Tax=Ceraceosorus guamensis TaxID=1522189 RepID=A0A316W7H7_9BASI|nr:hypothetical protein IE81DRAFT_336075 [Ceraceosorus guamensis]PWN45819.1 hypothetical protein IE81DRAFT_336075 [Ceraceosorus guamensis]